jgi:hypothetical protein
VKVDVKGEGKVVTRSGEEYLEVSSVKTRIRVGDSSVKVAVKDDRSGRLSEYKRRQVWRAVKRLCLTKR